MKAVPGRKRDVKDCEWIADLLRHGLLRASFVPDRFQRELRELTRYRRSLVEERAAEINRLQKTLEGANVKLASVASNVVGKSARAMIELLLAGSRDVARMAQLAHIDFLDDAVERVNKEIEERMRPYEAELDRLDPIPGGRTEGGRRDHCADRRGHEPLPYPPPSCLMGRYVSGK
jgi:transposase